MSWHAVIWAPVQYKVQAKESSYKAKGGNLWSKFWAPCSDASDLFEGFWPTAHKGTQHKNRQ